MQRCHHISSFNTRIQLVLAADAKNSGRVREDFADELADAEVHFSQQPRPREHANGRQKPKRTALRSAPNCGERCGTPAFGHTSMPPQFPNAAAALEQRDSKLRRQRERNQWPIALHRPNVVIARIGRKPDHAGPCWRIALRVAPLIALLLGCHCMLNEA